ncbi:hypothetical protein CMI38_01850 [Candidatus Pacearchaeota archaeon]|nr:hypothetical protein [Candidatus Pacearchaeota archaeon]
MQKLSGYLPFRKYNPMAPIINKMIPIIFEEEPFKFAIVFPVRFGEKNNIEKDNAIKGRNPSFWTILFSNLEISFSPKFL